MGKEQLTEIAKLSDGDLRREVARRATAISIAGFAPNGLEQLIVGSRDYRSNQLFIETGGNQGKYYGEEGFNQLWSEWRATYDPYSGENLAGTALYQHKRYEPSDSRFPQVDTPEYEELVGKMAEFGQFVRVLEERIGWEGISDVLDEVRSSIKRESLSPAELYIVFAREDIDEKLAESPDAVVGVFGITIFERVENRSRDEDCYLYTLGKPGTPELYEELASTHRQLDITRELRQTGDIIVYDDGGGMVHVGRIGPNGKDVISKWGPDGHVYQHPPLIVPRKFGNRINIFRPQTA